MIQGLTFFSLCMKSVMSTTRSRITGEVAQRLDADRARADSSDRNAAQVSFGLPFTIMPQLPHTPIRQDQRKESEPSRLSLM